MMRCFLACFIITILCINCGGENTSINNAGYDNRPKKENYDYESLTIKKEINRYGSDIGKFNPYHISSYDGNFYVYDKDIDNVLIVDNNLNFIDTVYDNDFIAKNTPVHSLAIDEHGSVILSTSEYIYFSQPKKRIKNHYTLYVSFARTGKLYSMNFSGSLVPFEDAAIIITDYNCKLLDSLGKSIYKVKNDKNDRYESIAGLYYLASLGDTIVTACDTLPLFGAYNKNTQEFSSKWIKHPVYNSLAERAKTRIDSGLYFEHSIIFGLSSIKNKLFFVADNFHDAIVFELSEDLRISNAFILEDITGKNEGILGFSTLNNGNSVTFAVSAYIRGKVVLRLYNLPTGGLS